MKIHKNIVQILEGEVTSGHILTPEEERELLVLTAKLNTLKKAAAQISDTDYFDTVIPRFREKLDSESEKKISAFSFSPFDIFRLTAGAVIPILIAFYLLQNPVIQKDEYSADTLTEISDYSQLQTIDEMAVNSPAEITETVDNSFREIISAGPEDLHVIMRESPATEGELDQLLEDSDLDEIIAQLENKKIL